MNIFLIYPIHLFSNIDNLKNKKIYLIEDKRFFTDFMYHKLKLAYHRATMKSYFDYLISKKIDVEYIDYKEDIDLFYKNISVDDTILETYDLCDNVLQKKLLEYIPKLKIIKTLNFLVDKDLLEQNINKFYNGKKFNHKNFYKWQRIRLNILVNDGKPVGGKWSFDEDNRKKMPNDMIIPKIIYKIPNDKNYRKEAIEYVEKNFKNNYGSLDNFIYPINHKDAKIWLKRFLQERFTNFGIYEDAVSKNNPFLFHSVLSPMMNIGLLTDTEVIKETMKYQNKVPINSFEGFIRQIIGWRNYIYATYLLVGDKMSKSNFFNHTNKLNKEIMWTAKTDILPIDNIIQTIVDYSYAHHIERLMYLGNYMLLCMINPKDVYEIFMEWTIDAYEWVMVPNVYGMSQFSDGGIIMNRPYFSSSNYILKMSNYKCGKNDNWCNILDALYYNFINKHEKYLKSNYSTARQVSHWNKKSYSEKKAIIDVAELYLDTQQ